MSDISITGLGISICFFFLRYAIPNMRPWLGWCGFALGFLLLISGDVSSMRISNFNISGLSLSTYVGVTILFLLVSVASAWRAYDLYRNGWPLKWTWGSFVMASYDQNKATARIELFSGMVENVSENPVRIDELKLMVGQTAKSFDVLLNDRFGKYLSVEQFEDIPARSDRIDIRALFKSETEALSESEYWSQIGSLQFVAKYAGREYRKQFSREEIMTEIDRVKPKPELPYPALKAKQ